MLSELKGDYANCINKILVPASRREMLAIDLFSGCGGLALGFEAQGFETVGFEMDEDCCLSYRNNLVGKCEQIFITPETELPRAAVIIGGPPCQPFSVNGKQAGVKDVRDGFPAFIAAIKKVNPDIWVCENVRGVFYRNRWYLERVIRELRSLGYIVQAKLLNARNYGVPQNRERVFVVGHRGGYEFPKPLGFVVTAGDALGELALNIPGDARFLTSGMDLYIEKYEKASCCKRPRDLDVERPARTVTCRNLAGATGDMMRIRLADGRRRMLSVREGARLQSFPDWFEFTGSEESQFKQIGNAVPPMLAFHIALSVRKYMSSEERMSEKEIEGINRRLIHEQANLLERPRDSEESMLV